LLVPKTYPYFCIWIVWYGALIHLGWAVLIALHAAAEGSTPVSGIVKGLSQLGLSSRPAIIIILVVSSLLALSVILNERTRTVWTILALLPQQMLLVMSSWASLRAMSQGMYADGIIRPHAFIEADQLPSLVAAAVYTVAIFSFHAWTARWRR